ncbi:hypothetical protein P872_24295 [Rhodonellum psychrophilum GCM71 = DSM 17998]|uniref:Uncharacterized protein n=2 Tax=Rhodonellum TaxID=336827 RepID=U5C8L4_9BACT|nr:hypothetical protein P872_24295 [Rhodonellum psychrophilum GCM71 = DSM 17998]
MDGLQEVIDGFVNFSISHKKTLSIKYFLERDTKFNFFWFTFEFTYRERPREGPYDVLAT